MNLHQNDDHGAKGGENNGPVTVIVTRTAKREKIKEFEEWMDGVIHEATKFEGHMGVNITAHPMGLIRSMSSSSVSIRMTT
jgi:antibiotic biosynthesis monooxygenase (ABM) superfamily enzyme